VSRVPAPALSKSAADRLLKSSAELTAAINPHIQQVALAAQRSSVTQRLEAAQAQYDAAEAAGDFRSIGALGRALENLKAESAKIALSQKDYLTLADRHAQLVQRVVSTCQDLAKAGKYVELSALVTSAENLKTLDLSALTPLIAGKHYGFSVADSPVASAFSQLPACLLPQRKLRCLPQLPARQPRQPLEVG
jgi:hypothetical protein